MKAIAAMSLNKVIGKDGKIPWHVSSDLKWFKKMTIGQHIIVGRTTFDSLPYLPERVIHVLARQPLQSQVIGRYEPYELRIVNDIDILPRNGIVIGGAKVYQQLLPYCEELYLTVVKKVVEGDTKMPPYEFLYKNREVIENDDEKTIFRFFN